MGDWLELFLLSYMACVYLTKPMVITNLAKRKLLFRLLPTACSAFLDLDRYLTFSSYLESLNTRQVATKTQDTVARAPGGVFPVFHVALSLSVWTSGCRRLILDGGRCNKNKWADRSQL